MERRQKDLDVAKAIGIILVVWAHANGPFSDYIYAFHMPLFFFISGILYKNNCSFKDYFYKKMRSLLLPFWCCNISILIIYWIIYLYKRLDILILRKYFLEIIFTVGKVPILGATWFLPALFWVSCSFLAADKIFSKYTKFSDCFLLIFASLILVVGIKITFPYRISRVLNCSYFYFLGYIYNKYLRERINKIKSKGLFVIVLIGVFVLLTRENIIDLSSNNFKYPVLFIVGAIMAILSVLLISYEIVNRLKEHSLFVTHMTFLGKNTMGILIWQFISFKITIMLQVIFAHAPIDSLLSFPIYDWSSFWWLIYIFCGIYGSLLFDLILKNCKLEIITKFKTLKLKQ